MHICKLDHRWRTTLIQKKQARLAKNGVSQEYIGPCIGPPILEKIEMYILTRAELLMDISIEMSMNYFTHFAMRYPVVQTTFDYPKGIH